MPPRISRSSVSQSKPRKARVVNKNRKRALDALSIAQYDHPDTHKVRRTRLGESEKDGPPRKKARVGDDEDEDEDDEDGEDGESSRRSQKSKSQKGPDDVLDLSEGSDSDGNRWRYGEVDDDDDESLDSDEAFGESDEERFEGFTFRGSSTNKKNAPKRRKAKPGPSGTGEIDLDEREDEGDSDGDSLGSDAVDLATMLDDPGSDEETGSGEADEGSSDDGSEDSESFGGFLDEENDEDDAEQLSRVKDLISAVYPGGEDGSSNKARFQDANEFSKPSDFAPVASKDASAADWSKFLPAGIDPAIKRAIASSQEAKLAKKGKLGKLEAPLPKRQQDKLDRTAATEKAKETLERWVDTVKHNRRAAHLSFPLVDPDAPGEPVGTDRLARDLAPTTDLEATIQSIMEASGMATNNGKTDEEQIRAFEELQTQKIPLEEVERRRAELRKARDLLFREEVRSKRIKKIKSKSYRRVHRRERERLAERERAELQAAGIDISEDERERNDRRRAEERMGAKHRDSKWAKGMKASGRAVWDEDAKAAVSDMARRNEELRRRIEGKTVRGEDSDADTDISSSDEDEDDDLLLDNPEEARRNRLQRQLDRANNAASSGEGESKLAGLAFMQRAEARRKAQNDEEVKSLARELKGGDDMSSSESNEEPATIGRKVFGPTLNSDSKPITTLSKVSRGEFEERENSSDDEASDKKPHQSSTVKHGSSSREQLPKSSKSVGRSSKAGATKTETAQPQTKSSLNGNTSTKSNKKPAPATDDDGWTVVTSKNTLTYGDEDENGDEADEAPEPFILRDSNPNHAIVSAAFGGDDVDESFSAEKAELMASEGDKVIDNTLPGWGSWVGDGVSKRARARHKGRFLTVEKGIKPEDRKDSKLDRVIISQAKVKKNTKFLASTLPFPFEDRKQYEASLRMPVGIGMTKGTVLGNTKPRVLVKKGVVIQPMEKPMV